MGTHKELKSCAPDIQQLQLELRLSRCRLTAVNALRLLIIITPFHHSGGGRPLFGSGSEEWPGAIET